MKTTAILVLSAFFLLTGSLKVTKSVNEENGLNASVFSAGSNLYYSSYYYNNISAALTSAYETKVALPALSERNLEIESWMNDPFSWVKAHKSAQADFEAEDIAAPALPASFEESEMKIESWMVSPAEWLKAEVMLPVVFEEPAVEIENWMINPKDFINAVPVYFEEAEPAIESWMVDPAWMEDKDLQIEDWMTDPWSFAKGNEFKEAEVQIESWMTDPKSFN